MKKGILFLYLIMPSVLVFIFSGSRFGVYMLHLYFITGIGIFCFFKFRFSLSSYGVIPLGLLMSPVSMGLYERWRWSSLPHHLHHLRYLGFPYFDTMLALYYYALPLSIASIITLAIVVSARKLIRHFKSIKKEIKKL